MKKQKTKLGARILSESELNAILPNADSVYEQITVFRNSISEEQGKLSDGQHEIEQKTNNIGIMGCRGAGKTSILKTFYHRLRTENEKKEKKRRDIILPLIIPENMSSGTTLMDAVLGRLKSVVEEREETRKDKYQGDCIYSGRTSLEQQYNALMKQYCYIKKDYRDILIQQFTTEQNYVDKTKKVFSSDSEFINLFHQFVVRLLQNGEEIDEKKTEENPMIFLFIDDVDLSINRCMDIVRTLLVYLSNPRIVTFISGDMETFEEELTLEFLRQEGALRKDVFRETYYTVNDVMGRSSLLERKKNLAYEYLKKIIPPAYRRTIRYWSLEERGNYRITGDDGSNQKSLAELLMEMTEEEWEELYFVYKEDGQRKCMGLAFHMFDDTSRGLNNVYNVLQEICDVRTEKKEMTEREETLLLWRLIETMVDSKPLYARYRSELLQQVIVLGQESVKVDFTNGRQLLYGEADNRKAKKGVDRFTAKERFSFFYLIDFSFRLFLRDQYDFDDLKKYLDLKNRIIQEYLSDETIDDRIAAKRKLIGCLTDGKIYKKYKSDSLQAILTRILQEGDLMTDLHLIRYLGRAEIYQILGDTERRLSDIEIAYKIAYAFSRAIQSSAETEKSIQDEITYLYGEVKRELNQLLNKLSLNPWMIYGRQLIDTRNVGIGMEHMGRGGGLAEVSFWNIEGYMNDYKQFGNASKLLWAEYGNRNLVYWIYCEEIMGGRWGSIDIRNNAEETVRAGLIKTIVNWLQEQNYTNRYEIKALREGNYAGLLEGKTETKKKEIQIIKQIDEKGLWDSDYAKDRISDYLRRKKEDYLEKMSQGRIIFDATQLVERAFPKLENCEEKCLKREYGYNLISRVRRVIFLSADGKPYGQGSFKDGKHYLRLEQVLMIQFLLERDLNGHTYIGLNEKKELWKFLLELKELPLVIQTSAREKIDKELQEREERFFAENLLILKDKQVIELGKSENWQTAISDICENYYYWLNLGEMETWIKEHFPEIAEDNYMCIKYLVQKEMIVRMKKKLHESENDSKELSWSDIEPAMDEKEYLFFFHSYLRYLQVNDSEVQIAGARAEDIAKLAEYILDSEIKADEKIQNEVYQAISEELELTEEEFETLF